MQNPEGSHHYFTTNAENYKKQRLLSTSQANRKPNADNTKLIKEQIDYQNPTQKDFLQFVPRAREMQHSLFVCLVLARHIIPGHLVVQQDM